MKTDEKLLTPALATDALLREHLALRDRFAHIGSLIEGLPARKNDRPAAMAEIIAAFRDDVLSHAPWEETVLYPLVDRLAGTKTAFTATARHEHLVIGRWIEGLVLEAGGTHPDVRRFARLADQLLGLALAHFEGEERVLLPVIDRVMTPEDLARELTRAPTTPGR